MRSASVAGTEVAVSVREVILAMSQSVLRVSLAALAIACANPPEPAAADPAAREAHDPTVDFARFRSYAFADDPLHRIETEKPGVALGNPFVERQVQRAIRYVLGNRGYLQEEKAQADFLVAINVGTRATTWYTVRGNAFVEPYATWFDRWSGFGSLVQFHSFQDGTIVIDLIDRESAKLVWHGWSTQPVPPGVEANEIIRGIVSTILDQFPPGVPATEIGIPPPPEGLSPPKPGSP